MSTQKSKLKIMHLASKSKAIIIIIILNNSGESGPNLDQTIHLTAHQFLS